MIIDELPTPYLGKVQPHPSTQTIWWLLFKLREPRRTPPDFKPEPIRFPNSDYGMKIDDIVCVQQMTKPTGDLYDKTEI